MRAGRRRIVQGLAMLLVSGGPLHAEPVADPPLPIPHPSLDAVPLPPPRPRDVAPPALPAPPSPAPAQVTASPPVQGPPKPPPAVTPPFVATPAAPTAEPAPTPGVPVPVEEELACARLFASRKVEARALPPIGGPGGCGVAAPVEVAAIVVSPSRRIPLTPAVTVDCAVADALADWVREDLVPAFDKGASPLAAVTGSSGYACRGRNGVAGARLSEHGRGNAVDIGQWRTADGRSLGVAGPDLAMLATLRSTACARFATVLGPGSDSYHEGHLHLDLEPRRHGTRLCQWTLP